MRSLLVLMGLGLLGACGGSTGRSRCDQEALRAAADATQAAFAGWQPASGTIPDYRGVVDTLHAACPGLPPGYRGFLAYSVEPVPDLRSLPDEMGPPIWKDMEALGPLLKHCPDYREVMERFEAAPEGQQIQTIYDGCRFAEVGLASIDELSMTLGDIGGRHSHALYLWLVDIGTPAEVARALVRPILFGTDNSLQIVRHLPRLPAASRGVPSLPYAPTVSVTQEGALFDGRPLLALEQGALSREDVVGARVLRLYEALGDDEKQRRKDAFHTDQAQRRPPLVIAAEPGLTWATTGVLTWTAVDAGYPVAVQVLVADPLHPLAMLPLVSAGVVAQIDVVVDARAIALRCRGREQAAEIGELASALTACGGGAVQLVVAADVPWQRVVDVVAGLGEAAKITALAWPAPTTVPAQAHTGVAQSDREEVVYIAVEPGSVVRIADGAATELHTPDGGRAWHVALSPQGPAYVLGFDRVYRIVDDALVPVTDGKAPTNGGSLVGFAPLSDREIWAYDELTVVRWNGERWDDLSPGPVTAAAGNFDVHRQVKDVFVDRDGRAWLSAMGAVYLREGDAWRGLAPAPRLGRAAVERIIADAEGLVHLQLSTRQFVRVVPGATPADGDRSASVTAPPGSVWVDDEKVTIVGTDGQRRTYTAGRELPGRVPGPVASDARGRLWVAGTAGLAVLGPGEARTVWGAGTLPALTGTPRDIVVRGRGPDMLPAVEAAQRGRLRGVAYFQGQPLPGAAVELCPHAVMIRARPCDGSMPTYATTTTADGAWELKDVPLGAYGVSIKTPEGWKIDHQASMTLGRSGAMRVGEVVDLGPLDVTGGMAAREMPGLDRRRK